jgi:hypothetical protein
VRNAAVPHPRARPLPRAAGAWPNLVGGACGGALRVRPARPAAPVVAPARPRRARPARSRAARQQIAGWPPTKPPAALVLPAPVMLDAPTNEPARLQDASRMSEVNVQTSARSMIGMIGPCHGPGPGSSPGERIFLALTGGALGAGGLCVAPLCAGAPPTPSGRRRGAGRRDAARGALQRCVCDHGVPAAHLDLGSRCRPAHNLSGGGAGAGRPQGPIWTPR